MKGQRICKTSKRSTSYENRKQPGSPCMCQPTCQLYCMPSFYVQASLALYLSMQALKTPEKSANSHFLFPRNHWPPETNEIKQSKYFYIYLESRSKENNPLLLLSLRPHPCLTPHLSPLPHTTSVTPALNLIFHPCLSSSHSCLTRQLSPLPHTPLLPQLNPQPLILPSHHCSPPHSLLPRTYATTLPNT